MNRYNTKKILAFDKNTLEKDICCEAKLLKIPAGAAKELAHKVANDVEKWASKRPGLTKADLDKRVTAELRKYNDDLSFIYQNRGKII